MGQAFVNATLSQNRWCGLLLHWFIQLYLSSSDCHTWMLHTWFIQLYLPLSDSIGSFNFICFYPALPCFSQAVDVLSTGCNTALLPKESELPCFPLIQDKTFIAGTDSTLFVFIRLHWFIQFYLSLSSVTFFLSGSGCYIDRM